jgi:hypothetical protein
MSGKNQELNMDALDKVSGGGMSDMSETDSMNLQMAMDNKSKVMESLSNIMKKLNSTASQITQNLK